MYRFITVTDKLKNAVFDFLMEQDECRYEYTDNEVMDMLDTAFSELRNVRNGFLPVEEISRYDLTVNGSYPDEIMPPDAAENNVLCEEAVHLTAVKFDEYISDNGEKTVERSYDIIYDVADDVVIPVYTVTISDNDVTSVYRTECDFVEDLNTVEFIISLSVQLAEKLKSAREVLEKVCDIS